MREKFVNRGSVSTKFYNSYYRYYIIIYVFIHNIMYNMSIVEYITNIYMIYFIELA